MDEEQKSDKDLRRALRDGSEYMNYDSVIDSIGFMPSEESIGIQIADLTVGAAGRHVNHNDDGYIRTFARSLKRTGGPVNGRSFKIYPTGTFAHPHARTAPWSATDREVHDIEFSRISETRLTWTHDGTPSHIWKHDFDSEQQ